MLELKYNFFVLLFYIFFQKNIQSGSANNQCLNLKLQPSEKLHIEFFFQSEYGKGIADIACPVVLEYKEKLTFEFKISPLTQGNVGALTCPNDNMCTSNRYLACVHKAAKGALNQCVNMKTITFDVVQLADCTCNHETDQVLIDNANAWAAYKLSDDKIPTLLLNGYWDPCLDVSSVHGFETYIYNIYH